MGALLRSQVATLVGIAAWQLFIENVLIGSLLWMIRYFPGSAAASVANSNP